MDSKEKYGSEDFGNETCQNKIDDLSHEVITLSYAKHEFEASKAAPFGRRLGAALIDGIFIGLVWLVFFVTTGVLYHQLVLSKTAGFVSTTRINLPAGWFACCVIIYILFVWLYFSLMESSRHQGTLGKLLFSIHVTDMSNNRLRISHSLWRSVVKFLGIPLMFMAISVRGEAGFVLAIISLMWPLTYLLTFFEIHGQAFHDKLTETLVRCGRPMKIQLQDLNADKYI